MTHEISTPGRALQFARSDWSRIWLLLLAGIACAMQIGKVPAALALLRAQFSVGLVASGWILSMFSAVGALFGSVAGLLADRFGAGRVTVASLLVMALASAVGGGAHQTPLLLISRALEGAGFVVTVVAVPSLLIAAAVERDRRIVPSMWGTYMPVGMALALAATPPVLSAFGWRAWWQLNAALLAGLAVSIAWSNWRCDAHAPPRTPAVSGTLRLSGTLRTLLRRPAVLPLAMIFACYTFQFLSVLGFLPTVLQERGSSRAAAATLTALAIMANALGNLGAGWLFTRRVTPRILICAGMIGMAAAELVVFAPWYSPSLQYAAAVAFSSIAGLVPASIFTAIPDVVPADARSTMMGIAVQASHIGQLVGPPTVAAIAAASGGWSASPLVLLPAAGLGLMLAWSMRSR
jgi:MFS family permease